MCGVRCKEGGGGVNIDNNVTDILTRYANWYKMKIVQPLFLAIIPRQFF